MKGTDHANKGRRFLFMDLDATLFDNTTIRKKAVLRAFSRLNLNISGEKALELYERIVKHTKGFQFVGFPNFRHFWNTPELYSVLIVLSTINKRSVSRVFEEVAELEHRIGESTTGTEHGKDNPNQLQVRVLGPETRKFLDRIQKLKEDKYEQTTIRAAIREFEKATAKIPLLRGAKDLIQSLHQAGIEQYIVTEGEPSIQKEKFVKLGLGSLISPRRLLVVDEKSHSSYLQVLKAIQDNPDNPSDEMNQPTRQKRDASARRDLIKLAVIGDRYDKDLAPLISLLDGNVLTIRLLHGKYKHQYTSEYLKEHRLPQPSFVTTKLLDAKRFLLDTDIWSQVEEIDSSKLG